jgi:hypothetical protein
LNLPLYTMVQLTTVPVLPQELHNYLPLSLIQVQVQLPASSSLTQLLKYDITLATLTHVCQIIN